MIVIYYTNFQNVSWDDIKIYVNCLNKANIKYITSLRNERDRNASLLGKLLLLKYLKEKGMIKDNHLPLLSYTGEGKPYFKDIDNINFSISHSNCLVGCAFCDKNIGFDLEKMEFIDIHEFVEVFTEAELNYIKVSNNPILRFYNLWTQKEALLKLIGLGFFFPPQHVDVMEKNLKYGDKCIRKQSKILNQEYSSSICYCGNYKDISWINVSIKELLSSIR